MTGHFTPFPLLVVTSGALDSIPGSLLLIFNVGLAFLGFSLCSSQLPVEASPVQLQEIQESLSHCYSLRNSYFEYLKIHSVFISHSQLNFGIQGVEQVYYGGIFS